MMNAEIGSEQFDQFTAERFPALVGGVVTEKHACLCREQGHARHEIDGKDTGLCPRCGDVTDRALTDSVNAAMRGVK